MKILLLNGPNINLIGKRETKYYGNIDYDTLISQLQIYVKPHNFDLYDYQSNNEGEIINLLHKIIINKININFIILNPGALTHTSIALRDAILATNIPFIEVHISNIYNRDQFRNKSYFSDIAKGIIIGMGTLGYFLAIDYILEIYK